MILRPFEYVESKTVDEAVAALQSGGEDARVIAGGTALVPLMKHSVLRPRGSSASRGSPGSPTSPRAPSGGLRIGGVATHWAVSHATLVQRAQPAAGLRVRTGGEPDRAQHGDAGRQPLLRRVGIGPVAGAPRPPRHRPTAGPGGARTVPITEFFTGFYETALHEAEVLTSIDVPAMPAGARWRYLKWTPRAQEDKALVGLAAMLVLDGRRCRVARLAVGGVGASPVVLARAEQALEGQELDDATIARAADTAAGEVEPVDDLQGTAEYRRDMLRVWVRRVVAGLAEGTSSCP